MALPGCELVRNQRLAKWLEYELEKYFGDKEKFIFVADKENEHRVSRFSTSRDDFFFFLKPSSSELGGAGVYYPDQEVELTAVDGDNKEEAKERNKHQIVANMNKCAAEIAYAAAKRNILFSTITVLGLLVDYSSENVLKAYELKFDFNNCVSTLKRCENLGLSITETFSRVVSVLTNAIVKK